MNSSWKDELAPLLKNNEEWAKQKAISDPSYFATSSKEQLPPYLWIGCSDSRVPAIQVTGLESGQIFVHRNIANLCSHTDFSFLSVLEFAVMILKVRHVIVCGHYNCGGIKAAMEEHHLGLVDNWLRHVRDIYSSNKQELEKIPNIDDRLNKLVELNVIKQVLNICHTTIVQVAWAKEQPLYIHSWVYDLSSGRIKDLNNSFSKIEELEEIYRIKPNLKKPMG
jgi:carbonic anhydrase